MTGNKMEIRDQDPYSAIPQMLKTTAADTVEKANAAKASSSQNTAKAGEPSSVTPAMNTTGTTLTSQTMVYMINQQGEKVEGTWIGGGRIDYQSMLDDPETGAQFLAGPGRKMMGSLMKMPSLDASPEEWETFKAGHEGRKAEFDRANEGREALYDQMMAEGKSPAEIYKEMLRHDLTQPDSYWAARDFRGEGNLRQIKLQELADINRTEARMFVESGSDIPRSAEVIARDYALDLATDPAFAEQQAYMMGNSMDMLPIPAEVFEKAAAEGNLDMVTGGYGLNDPGNPVLKVLQQRQELYEYLKENGATPIQIIKEIHKFNISLPLSYSDEFLDKSGSHPDEAWRDWQKQQLSGLNEALDWAGI